MPGLQADGVVAALGSPIKKSKLSLKFFQKKETKRALDFSETQAEEQNVQPQEAEEPASCDQVVPGPCPTSPLTCERRENLVPFVGLNNLGNTCYLNSILQVLYYCPGFKEAIKTLYKLSKRRDKQKEAMKTEPGTTEVEEQVPAQVELLGSFYSLITSVEQLQSNFLLTPDKYSEGELATPPRKLLNSLRQLNPMYEGYLQHDAQEVLQCILGYVQEASESICKEEQQPSEKGKKKEEESSMERRASEEEAGAEGQLSGKRKSDTEAGNAKKKSKSQTKGRNAEEEEEEKRPPLTRSKRKSSGDITTAGANEHPAGESHEEGEAEKQKEGGSDAEEGKGEGAPKETGKRKKRARLSWLKSTSGKQPSIFSKFRSMGRLSTQGGSRAESREDHGKEGDGACKDTPDSAAPISEQMKSQSENECKAQNEADAHGFDVLKRLFQGQLVLRTRCLECECFTERREDFQDISVPVQEDEPAPRDSYSEVSPDPKPELKTLKWAISQFASVERIVGEDKYFCETCHHYTEAERSLLFDKTPEVITIHLKCFAANTSELDPYAGLSKVNTPLQTPLQLSLEEWSTGTAPRGQQYQLFAVVMHSGVTISSGHYTTYIRMSDLHKVSLREEGAGEEEEEAKQEKKQTQTQKELQGPKKEESEAAQEYDDGEVSFSLSGRGASSASAVTGAKTAGGKKAMDGVGLLGGQRSLATYELGSSTKQQPASTEKSSFPSSSQPLSGGVKKEKDAAAAEGEQARQGQELALHTLRDYEGKWLLFDDSEVRLFEEEDFLRACSPETCSTSTPYLLFYRRVEAHK